MLRRMVLRLIGDYPCRTFVEAVTDYLEGTMPARDRRTLERHLRRCAGCDRYLQQLRMTIDAAGRLTTTDVDALGPEARERLLRAFAAFHTDRV